MRRPRRLSLFLLTLAASGGGARPASSAPESAAPTAAQVRTAEAEERRLANLRIAAGAQLRRTETEAAEAAAQVEALTARQHEAEQRLAERAAELAPLLPLMERLGLFPVETLLAVPAQPGEAMRGLGILHGLARHLAEEARAYRAETAAAQEAAQAAAASLPRLQAAQEQQANQAAELDRQLEAARAGRLHAEDAAAEMARRAAADAARADSLRAALVSMAVERARAEARAREDLARADKQRQEAAATEARRRQEALARQAGPGLVEKQDIPAAAWATGPAAAPSNAPVAGQVVRGWGDITDAGPSSGISIRSPPAAHVLAPCTGRVAYSGPFRSFGVLLILDCGGGYHFVLSGFERLAVQVGMAVWNGEPVGVMPAWDPRGGGTRPSLYMELRRDGQPVNPAPFLRAHG